MIITLDLCLRFGDNEIISSLNLHIEKGEFVFICGQAGSGKTSLLRVFALQETPSGGRVVVDGSAPTHTPAPPKSNHVMNGVVRDRIADGWAPFRPAG